jgi:hypothetical protein
MHRCRHGKSLQSLSHVSASCAQTNIALIFDYAIANPNFDSLHVDLLHSGSSSSGPASAALRAHIIFPSHIRRRSADLDQVERALIFISFA